MNRRTWGILGTVLVFAGLLAYTLWSGRPQQPSDALTLDAFWQEDRNAVRRVEVLRSDGERLVFDRMTVEPEPVAYRLPARFQGVARAPFDQFLPPGPETAWWLVEPEPVPADPGTLASLLFSLAEPRPLAQVTESAAERAAYGLEPPQATVRLHVAQEGEAEPIIRELLVGEATPLRSSTGGIQSYYVATPEREGVYTLSAYPLETLLGEHQGFRLMQFARFGPERAEGIRLLWEGKAPVELSRSGDAWRLHQPVQAPADRSAVQDLLFDLELMRAEEILAEEATDEVLAHYGLENPRGEALILLSPASSSAEDEPSETSPPTGAEAGLPHAQVLWVGNFLPDGSGVTVRLAGERTVYRIRGDRIQTFFDVTAQPFRLAQRSLLPPTWPSDLSQALAAVRWTGDGETRSLVRDEAGWADEAEVRALFQQIRSFRAQEVLAAGADAERQAGYRPGEALPAGAEQLVLEPAAGIEPSTPVTITRLPDGEDGAIRLLWAAGDDRLLFRADLADWEALREAW